RSEERTHRRILAVKEVVSHGDPASAASARASSTCAGRGLRASPVAASPRGAPRHRRARDGPDRRQLRAREARRRPRLLNREPRCRGSLERNSLRVVGGELVWNVPTLADVLAARRRIAPYLQPTPLYGYAA